MNYVVFLKRQNVLILLKTLKLTINLKNISGKYEYIFCLLREVFYDTPKII